MTDTNPRPMLANAHEAADTYLMRQTLDNGMAPDVAKAMATDGFTVATRTLSELRKQGVGEQSITDAFRRQLDRARETGDVQRVIAAEFTLAVWGGMQRDLAAYLSSAGTETQR
jgi:hypothetical protein